MSISSVALVTGASRNIGREIAKRLSRDGHAIVVHVGQDRRAGEETVSEIRALGAQAELISADISQPASCTSLVAEAVSKFGRLDVLVNNAAIRPEASFEDITYDDWRRVMAIALDAPFLISQAAVPFLAQSPAASIVHIGGLTGHTGASRRAHVVTAKAGIVGLTKAMAHDLAQNGIMVNCVVPGLIETNRNGDAARPFHHGSRTNLLGRRGTIEDVAESVSFLCHKENRYLTGQTLHVNGGAFLP